MEGTDLQKVLGTSGVQGIKTDTNDIIETWKFLGIEAARTIIMTEIQKTMGAHGMSIDVRHTMLLADCMTFKVRPQTFIFFWFCTLLQSLSTASGLCDCQLV